MNTDVRATAVLDIPVLDIPVLDTAVQAETPEGIVIELRPAGMPARCYAFLLDWGIRMVLMSVLGPLARIMGGVGTGILLTLYFLIEWFYPVAFELSRWGATPGKRVFGLKTVMDNGLPITPAASLTRNLLRVVDFMPALFGFGIFSMLWRRDYKRIGDIVAATLVVYQPKPFKRIALDNVTPVAPPRNLSIAEQKALLALAARAPRLTTARVDELAAVAAPLLGLPVSDQTPPQVITRQVLGVAQWLLGNRESRT